MNAKVFIGMLVMAVWGALVASQRTPIGPFVDALKDVLYGVCIFHVASKGKP
jgi:hypothetical protein